MDHVVEAGRGPLCLQKGFYEMAQLFRASPVQKLKIGKKS